MEPYELTSFLIVLLSNPLFLWDHSSVPFLNNNILFTLNSCFMQYCFMVGNLCDMVSAQLT